MPNRREILWFAITGATGSSLLMSNRRAEAQILEETSDILDGSIEFSPDFYRSSRRLSASLIDIRSTYNGPFGYENAEWANGAFDALRFAFDGFGENANGFELARSRYFDFINTEFGFFTARQMEQKLNEQRDAFSAWCEEIGIIPGSPLFLDLISSQALFTILYTQANQSEVSESDGLPFFDSVTWVWPFCGD
ncbi:MAG: hypothetical protein ACE360_04050 [Hyphomicrobiales bacterium]